VSPRLHLLDNDQRVPVLTERLTARIMAKDQVRDVHHEIEKTRAAMCVTGSHPGRVPGGIPAPEDGGMLVVVTDSPEEIAVLDAMGGASIASRPLQLGSYAAPGGWTFARADGAATGQTPNESHALSPWFCWRFRSHDSHGTTS
jgi:hypothetical protein